MMKNTYEESMDICYIFRETILSGYLRFVRFMSTFPFDDLLCGSAENNELNCLFRLTWMVMEQLITLSL